MALKVHQLPDNPPVYILLTCAVRHTEVSADRGDYFAADPNTELRCEVCDRPMQIVEKSVCYDYITGAKYLKGESSQ